MSSEIAAIDEVGKEITANIVLKLEVRSGGLFLSTMIVDMVELNMVKNGIIAILKELEKEHGQIMKFN